MNTAAQLFVILLACGSHLSGQVDIDIELDSGKTVSFKTSPINVAVMMAFEEKGGSSSQLPFSVSHMAPAVVCQDSHVM